MCRSGMIVLAVTAVLSIQGCRTETGKKEIREAVESARKSASAERDAYARDIEKTLHKLDEETKELRRRAEEATGETRKNLEKRLEEVRERRHVAAERLEELRSASAENWERLRKGVGNAVEELRKSFD